MRLIGTKTEADFREQLISSHEHHFSPQSTSGLKNALEAEGHDTSFAFVLKSVSYQDKDLFVVLVSEGYVVNVEINRHDFRTTSPVHRIDLAEYKKGLGNMNQIELLVAHDLMEQKRRANVR
jgi:hypothetical protein